MTEALMHSGRVCGLAGSYGALAVSRGPWRVGGGGGEEGKTAPRGTEEPFNVCVRLCMDGPKRCLQLLFMRQNKTIGGRHQKLIHAPFYR
ncbi:unnamed protein product [Prorocentrum cordatum]|uniref:Uncharacterized protein n=1 Tax=Prorocentrum cordatum TaxID=2364126 RepID=A0ABN9XFS2_9DINO|nr:unnamed protein product [Polarella glacialis]